MPIHPGDTEETLHERIKQVERRLYPATIRTFLASTEERRAGSPRPEDRGGDGAMRALLSVYDKQRPRRVRDGPCDELGWELIASGGTAAALGRGRHRAPRRRRGDGGAGDARRRVKTLHPAIHGGILADRSKPAHLADLAARGSTPIDLVVCNLYPFWASPSIEMIDVGGPTMVRAAAKNHAHVAVVVDPADYEPVSSTRSVPAATSPPRPAGVSPSAAFAHTAAYDAAITAWLASAGGPAKDPAAPRSGSCSTRREELRYGENPHQAAARYHRVGERRRLVGRGHAARRPGAFVHQPPRRRGRLAALPRGARPRGGGHRRRDREARQPLRRRRRVGSRYRLRAGLRGRPLSAFGGIVAIPGTIDARLAERIVANPLADVLVAYGYEPAALEMFAARRKNMRALAAPVPRVDPLAFRQFCGGFLVQERDRVGVGHQAWRVVTARQPTAEQWRDAELAWLVCARTTSNAIVLAKDGQIVGVGCGQQNRRDSARLAGEKAAGRADGGVGASDAFFPFRDALDAVCDAGVAVVVQPGGSLRDDEVIAAADERGIAMVLTGERHFRH